MTRPVVVHVGELPELADRGISGPCVVLSCSESEAAKLCALLRAEVRVTKAPETWYTLGPPPEEEPGGDPSWDGRYSIGDDDTP